MKRFRGKPKFFEDTEGKLLMSKCVGVPLACGTLSLAPPSESPSGPPTCALPSCPEDLPTASQSAGTLLALTVCGTSWTLLTLGSEDAAQGRGGPGCTPSHLLSKSLPASTFILQTVTVRLPWLDTTEAAGVAQFSLCSHRPASPTGKTGIRQIITPITDYFQL